MHVRKDLTKANLICRMETAMQDYISDRNPTPLFWLFDQDKIPNYVKDASVYEEDNLTELSDESFASKMLRRFPVHTKVSTFLSAAYYYGNQLDYPDVEARIKSAAEAHGIEGDVEDLHYVFQPKTTKQAGVLKAALTLDIGDGNGEQHFYPINTKEALVASAETAAEDYHTGRLPLELHRQVSMAIMKEATDLSVDLREIPGSVQRLGTHRVPDFDHALTCVNIRKSAANLSDEVHDVYTDVIKSAKHEFENSQQSFVERDLAMTKWAELLLDLDRQNGIERYDGQHLLTPYETIFSGETYEEIEKAGSQVLFVNDAPVPVQAVKAIPEKEIHNRFNKDVACDIIGLQKEASEDVYGANTKLGLLSESDTEELLRLALKYGD